MLHPNKYHPQDGIVIHGNAGLSQGYLSFQSWFKILLIISASIGKPFRSLVVLIGKNEIARARFGQNSHENSVIPSDM